MRPVSLEKWRLGLQPEAGSKCENLASRSFPETFSRLTRENFISETDQGYNPKRHFSNRMGLIGPYLNPVKNIDFRPFSKIFRKISLSGLLGKSYVSS